jgi:predicted alpha/beta-fold hydrolase
VRAPQPGPTARAGAIVGSAPSGDAGDRRATTTKDGIETVPCCETFRFARVRDGVWQRWLACRSSQEVGVRTNFVVAMVTCACLQGCASTDLSGLPDLPAGRTISFDGESIFVRQAGEGPDVVLLHGLGDSSLGWQFLEEPLLQAGYRVTVWDALGAGRSSKPSGGDYSLAAHLRRLVRVLDALAIENAAIVGHSLGGSLALGLAQAHPGRTAALCLIDRKRPTALETCA